MERSYALVPEVWIGPDGERRQREWKCQFAPPGTWGHECGKPATVVAVTKSTPFCSYSATRSGLHYSGRCDRCAAIVGLENTSVIRFERIGESEQINDYSR